MMLPQGFPKLPPDFEYETEVITSVDGENDIFLNLYKRKGVTPKRALMIVHGQGEHGARYQHFAHYLKDQYDVILAPDLRGHGRSEGVRGHVEHFDDYVDDALLAWDALGKKMGSGCVRDWFGHSMGGTITLRAFQFQPNLDAANVILSSPALDLTVKVPLIKDLAAKVLSRVWGSLQMETGLNPATLTHDPAVVAHIKKDSLHHTKGTSKFYLGFVSTMEQLREATLRIPTATRILFQLAGDDLIVSTPASEVFFEHLQHGKKMKIVYPGLYHEIYNESAKDQVFADLVSWLNQGAKS
jgi:lysophospholipase